MKGYDAWLAREPEETCIHAGIECEYNTGGDAHVIVWIANRLT